jgi:hypothetical protein
MSLGYTSTRRYTLLYTASARRPPCKVWIAWMPSFNPRPGGADGTLALYGDLNGRAADIVSGNPDPGKADFVDFLAEIIVSQPTDHEIHVIADNLSANKTGKVCRFFQANPNLRIHSTPAYFNWIKLIEIWFSKIQRNIISRNNNCFDSDFARTLFRYIRKCHKRRTRSVGSIRANAHSWLKRQG